ncbi:hypothetical protein FRUB_06580 [Fimbriiglobus ruber]|uniref:Transposase n=1 Tax=Fimbriiglobus ruber TaxID=1908690 RepID=A0A225D785_9BACT|nr:hypothetical protein FRUB_06580 [Fimbriiglobus ruber]
MIPDDHDQRFKALIRLFFADFLRLFFAEWTDRFDLSEVEWLETELLPDPPDGARHRLDLVAKLRTREPVTPDHSTDIPSAWLALVHIEVESPDRTTQIKPRLPSYYFHLSERYRTPVLPIVLYLNVGLDGIGVDTVVRSFWELEVLKLQYLYVGLPGLNAEPYMTGDNWLGVALSALMRIPEDRAEELGLAVLRRLSSAPVTDQQRYLLSECFEAYLPIEPGRLAELRGILAAETLGGTSPMQRNKTSYDIGKEVGWQEGRQEGRQEGLRLGQLLALETMLENQFGPLSAETLLALRALPNDALRQLVILVPKSKSLAELGLQTN